MEQIGSDLLLRVLSLVPPSLDVLLVCKRWHQEVLQCPDWWKQTGYRHGQGSLLGLQLLPTSGRESPGGLCFLRPREAPALRELLGTAGGRATLLRGLQRRAAHLRLLGAVLKGAEAEVLLPLLQMIRRSLPRFKRLFLKLTFGATEEKCIKIVQARLGPCALGRAPARHRNWGAPCKAFVRWFPAAFVPPNSVAHMLCMQAVAALKSLRTLQLQVSDGEEEGQPAVAASSAASSAAMWRSLPIISRLTRLQLGPFSDAQWFAACHGSHRLN